MTSKLLGLAAAGLLAGLAATSASAGPIATNFDQFVYSVTDGPTWTWVEPSNPTPTTYASGVYFSLPSVVGDPGGGVGFLDFYAQASAGGFDSVANTFYADNNAQVYLNDESAPLFVPGIYTGTDGTGVAATLAISGIPSVPEPGTLALLGFGIAGAGLVRKRKGPIRAA